MNQSALILPVLALLSGCVPARLQPASDLPVMAWDHRPDAAEWTRATLAAVAKQDAVLAARVPEDISQWCPAYERSGLDDRRAFWAGLVSTVGRYESRWNPSIMGGGGRYVGVMQISLRSAGNYGCAATTPAALKDGAANLSYAVNMMSHQVARDGLVAGDQGNRGIGRDWMPFRQAAKRQEMADWTSKQAYCRAKG
jgi:hypothetical protein